MHIKYENITIEFFVLNSTWGGGPLGNILLPLEGTAQGALLH